MPKDNDITKDIKKRLKERKKANKTEDIFERANKRFMNQSKKKKKK